MTAYWSECPPVHVSVSSYLRAAAGEKSHPERPVDPSAIDWSSMETTARKPTEAELRGSLEQIHG